MKILSIIPARGGSKGIKLKNLVLINKKPLLTYTINASLKSKKISRTIVSTDHKKIEKLAKKLGVEVIIRPKNLANDSVSLEPVIEHVLENLQNKENFIPDVIVILQNTSPLRLSKHIDEAISLFYRKKYDSVISGFSAHYFCWINNKNNKIKPVGFNPKKRPNRQQMPRQLFENGAIFITKYSSFKKSKCRVSGRIGFYEMPMHLSYDVNNYDDLKRVEKIIKQSKINFS